MNREQLAEKADLYQYYILGAMVMGGIAGTVAGSRMIQSMFPQVGEPTVPTGVTVLIFSSVCFGVASGYLLKDIQLEKWER